MNDKLKGLKGSLKGCAVPLIKTVNSMEPQHKSAMKEKD